MSLLSMLFLFVASIIFIFIYGIYALHSFVLLVRARLVGCRTTLYKRDRYYMSPPSILFWVLVMFVSLMPIINMYIVIAGKHELNWDF